jgi:hypothetical protein
MQGGELATNRNGIHGVPLYISTNRFKNSKNGRPLAAFRVASSKKKNKKQGMRVE